MSQLTQIARRSLLSSILPGLALALLVACGGSEGNPAAPAPTPGGDTGGTMTGGETTTKPDPYSFGEAEAGVTVGPFGDFKLFRSGCGEQLWSRFIPRENFVLGEQVVRDPRGRALRTQYFEAPAFSDKRKTYRLVSDAKGFEPGSYEIDFKVQGAAGNVVTHTVKVELKDGLYTLGDAMSFGSLRTPSALTVNSNINGDVQRVFTYDEQQCLIGSTTLLSPAKLVRGQPSEIQVTGTLQSTKKYRFVMQGVNSATRYTYYATVDTQ